MPDQRRLDRRGAPPWGTAAALLLALALAGCFGPSYAGGPTSDDPHGVVVAGEGITLWRVDGYDTASRSGSIRVEPGHRSLRVRIEYPIESDSPEPYEYRQMQLHVEEGRFYRLRRGDGQYEPYEVVIDDGPLR